MPVNRKILNLRDDLFTGSLFDDIPVHPSIEREARRHAEATREALLEPMDGPAGWRPGVMFISFGSGSSGNSSYIGTGREGIIIDAGVDNKFVVQTLADNGIDMKAVKGIIVTHDHGDHIRYIYSLVSRYPHIGVYCTPRCFNGIMRRHNVSRRLKDYHRPIYKEHPFTLAGFEVTAFDVSHDGSDNAGFFISGAGDSTDGVRFAIATDLGCITPRVDHYMRQARFIVIESNYDARMLANGPYPTYLKARIAAPNGHLDNMESARFVSSIVSPGLSHIFLCHLSHDNNTPAIALEAMRRALAAVGIDRVGEARESAADRQCALQLVALPRHEASPLYYLY